MLNEFSESVEQGSELTSSLILRKSKLSGFFLRLTACLYTVVSESKFITITLCLPDELVVSVLELASFLAFFFLSRLNISRFHRYLHRVVVTLDMLSLLVFFLQQ